MIFCLVDNFSLLEYSSLDNKTARGADFRLRAGLWPVTLNLIRIMPAEVCAFAPLGDKTQNSFRCGSPRRIFYLSRNCLRNTAMRVCRTKISKELF